MEEKGLAIETAEKIGTFVEKRGPPLEILSELKKEGSQFMENSGSVVALNELDILFKALEKSKCIDKVVFDLSLARGLDYYTGVIYEAVFKGATQVRHTVSNCIYRGMDIFVCFMIVVAYSSKATVHSVEPPRFILCFYRVKLKSFYIECL